MSLSARFTILEFAEAEVQEGQSSAQKSEALVVSGLLSCQGFWQMDVRCQRFGWDVFAQCGVQFEASCRLVLFGSQQGKPAWPRGSHRLSRL